MQAPPCYDCATSSSTTKCNNCAVRSDQELQTKIIQTRQELKALEDEIQTLQQFVEEKKYIKSKVGLFEFFKPIEEKKDVIIKVGPFEFFKTIAFAGNQLIKDFGINGSGYKCTILLDASYIWDWNVTIDQDFSWITLKSNVPIRVSDECDTFLTLINNGKINFEVSLLLNRKSYIETMYAKPNAALYVRNCTWKIKNDCFCGAQFYYCSKFHIFFENVKIIGEKEMCNITPMINCGSKYDYRVDNALIKDRIVKSKENIKNIDQFYRGSYY